MTQPDPRDSVAGAYTKALERSKRRGGCCGPAPAPTEIEKTRRYGDEAERFAETAQSSFGCGNPVAFAGVEPGQTVVDLGSGAGLDLLIAAEKVGPGGKVIGVDMTDAMIDAARAAAAKAGFDNVEVRKGYIEELPIDAGSVDWVISNCVINLSPDKPKVFRELSRVLKDGGRFSISDIVVDVDLPDWIRQSAPVYSACVAGAISEEAYLQGLRDAGLQDVAVKERLVYDEDQILGLLDGELEAFGVDPELVKRALPLVTGKVWSANIVGHK